METEGNTQTTLRDTLSVGFDKLDVGGEKASEIAPTTTVADTTVSAAPAADSKTDGRTAGRKRDESGKLLPGKAEKPEAAPAAPAAPARERPKYPSTWKRDYEPKWATVDHDLADEIVRREGDYAKGVSTYKTEYDRLKPFGDAVTPYMQLWQQAGVQPHEAVKNLAETDRILRSGSKEEKLRLVAYLAQSYEIPMHEMLVQGEDGKIYFNQQYMQQQQPRQQGMTPEQVKQLAQEEYQKVAWLQKVKDFREAKDSGGNPLYSHLSNEVEETMAGLLRAGLAKDLQSAYKDALALPKHSHLLEAELKQQAEAKAAAEAKVKAEAAAKARSNTVSTKSQSPTGMVNTGNKVRKGLRETISENVESLGSG